MSANLLNLAHILLVEDNEGDVLLTLEAFEECNVKTEISVAKNGQEALDFLFKRDKYLNAKRPDLILLDINIPIFNGHEVLQQIKTDPELKKIPVIMLTTSSNQKDIDKAYENHCNSYVEKPLNIVEFLAAIIKIEQFWLQLTTKAS
ncbi:response regulator [Flavobacterium sp. F-380]|uniref:Response regulator n=1 Tax=Flavobacterium kayseriense TaxID=2764714 RepID=A0ABR7J8L4_9FLAO|nr:response regulator [Flavobacterium kayseriense]MBC5841889.1 response regulator [Flavobacterium kayseriense]MBC5848418.1 response regulator [Flavobacterium kayseriense]